VAPRIFAPHVSVGREGELLDLDVRGLNHGRPLFNFGLVMRGKRLRRLLARSTNSCPTSAIRFCTAGSLSASTTAEPSILLTCSGVPFGTHIPRQVTTCSGGPPASSIVGISGNTSERFLANMAYAFIVPPRRCPSARQKYLSYLPESRCRSLSLVPLSDLSSCSKMSFMTAAFVARRTFAYDDAVKFVRPSLAC